MDFKQIAVSCMGSMVQQGEMDGTESMAQSGHRAQPDHRALLDHKVLLDCKVLLDYKGATVHSEDHKE